MKKKKKFHDMSDSANTLQDQKKKTPQRNLDKRTQYSEQYKSRAPNT